MKLEVIDFIPEKPVYPYPLLFVHGAFQGGWCWQEHFLPYFSKKGYKAYAMSLRGHGKSEGYEALLNARLGEYIEDVLQVMNRLKEKPVLVGHSMGGAIVQIIAARHQEDIDAMVLMSPSLPDGMMKFGIAMHMMFSGFKKVYRLARFQLGKMKSPESDVLFPISCLLSDQLPEQERLGYARRMQAESVKVKYDLARKIVANPREITIPKLIMGAEKDWFIPASEVKRTAAAYGCSAFIVPGSGHEIQLDINWQIAADAIINFLSDATAD
ncbi:MAG: alpha/beta hydrolase [Candidatus Aminicenantes bacterium]|jgi:pimeloyl-ACP methyl ester carboxylesterase